MALDLRSQLCTFVSSTNCNEISFDPHSFSEGLFVIDDSAVQCELPKFDSYFGK